MRIIPALIASCVMSVSSCAVPVSASDKPLLGLIIGTNVADLVTTEMARVSGNGREANPLLQNQKVFWGVKVGATTVEAIVVHQLWTFQHKKASTLTALLIGGLNGLVAWHNLGVARMK